MLQISFYQTNSILAYHYLQYGIQLLYFMVFWLGGNRIKGCQDNGIIGSWHHGIIGQFIILVVKKMLSKQQLTGRLRLFVEKVKRFKKLLGEAKKIEENGPQFMNIINENQDVIEAIQASFRHIYNNKENNVTTDKIKSEFDNLLKQYHLELKKYEKIQRKSVSAMRERLSELNANLRKSRTYTEEESQRGIPTPDIQMYEVNQETLHYERMIHIKEGEIKLVKEKMQDAIKVQENMKSLVMSQGKQLDVAEVNIDKANENVHEAHENLIDARQNHMSANKKKLCIFAIVTIILLVILIPILVKFTK